MADYDGYFFGFQPQVSGLSILELLATGSVVPPVPVPSAGNSIYEIINHGWYSKMDSTIIITNHYHKRGWRVESDDYVEWDSTDRNTPYPGGGTVEPAVGTVVFQWVTYSNGQLPS